MLEPHIAVLFVTVTSGCFNLVVTGILEASSKILFVYKSMCVKYSFNRQKDYKVNEIKFKQKINTLKFNDSGLIPCVAQDHESRQVLMLAWGSKDTLCQSFSSGLATYWSRSRGEVWIKGKTSGNIQEIKKIHIDCDGDTVLFEVKQTGAACHTGSKSCFFTQLL